MVKGSIGTIHCIGYSLSTDPLDKLPLDNSTGFGCTYPMDSDIPAGHSTIHYIIYHPLDNSIGFEGVYFKLILISPLDSTIQALTKKTQVNQVDNQTFYSSLVYNKGNPKIYAS